MAAATTIIAIKKVRNCLNNTNEYWDVGSDSQEFPPAFREVAETIPLVENSLQQVESTLRRPSTSVVLGTTTSQPPVPYTEMTKSLQQCLAPAQHLEKIFEAVITTDQPTSCLERYRTVAATVLEQEYQEENSGVEYLMKSILDTILAKQGPLIILPPTHQQTTAHKLQEALRRLSEVQPSLPRDERLPGPTRISNPSFNHSGSGVQAVHLGTGDQNINHGSGPMFNSGRFMAPFHFGGMWPGAMGQGAGVAS